MYLDDTAAGLQSSLGQSLLTVATTVTGSVTLSGAKNGCFARGDSYGPELFTSSGTGLFGYAQALVAADTGTFDSIRNLRFRFDVAYLTGIHVDDQVTAGANATSTSIIADFADWITVMRKEVSPCHGVMDLRPHNLRTTSSIISYITGNLLTTSYGYYNQSAKWINAGPILYSGRIRPGELGTMEDVYANVSVVAGPSGIFNHPDMNGDYLWESGGAYAGYLTTLPPESSATQSQIPGIKGYATPYPQTYANMLTNGVGADFANDLSGGGAYVVLVRDQLNSQGALVVNDDVTAAQRDNQYRNYQTVSLCNSIQKDLQASLRRFLGKSTGGGVIASMETAVQNVLDGYASSEGIRGGRGTGYDFKIDMIGPDASIGSITVTYWLAPASVVRRINLVCAVRN